MPKVFTKGCKIKVIEYGSTNNDIPSWNDFKNYLADKCSFGNIRKMIAG